MRKGASRPARMRNRARATCHALCAALGTDGRTEWMDSVVHNITLQFERKTKGNPEFSIME